MPNSHSLLRFAADPDGGIVLDLENDRLFSVNPTACLIVQGLKQGHSEQQIVAAIRTQTGAEPEMIQTDVRDFLAELDRHALRRRFALEANNGEASK